MKITYTVTMASALLLAAGCAHEEHTIQTTEQTQTTVTPTYSYYSPQSEYTTQVPSSSLPVTASSGSATYQGETAVVPDSQSDNVIVAKVRETLLRDPEIAFVVPNLQITANNGAVILNGSVQSDEQRRQVLAKVRDTPGVVNVNNQLNVMSGPNNSNGSQLNPTSSSSGTDRLYKDAADGPDISTNSVLNPTSRENGSLPLYRQSNDGESASDLNSSITTTSQWDHSTNTIAPKP